MTTRQAMLQGRMDLDDHLTRDELDNIAESFIENFGGALGERLAAAYRKGAGI